MCDLCKPVTPLPATGKRKRLWELSSGWHCAVVGTCVSLADLRALAKKLSVTIPSGWSVDYQLHGFFVKESESANRPGKLLNKLLDKRHAVSIRKCRGFDCAIELEAFWQDALDRGDIPGPYWAILTHPAVTQALCDTMFADVHMLSHLVGASNRADIRRLQDLENENGDLRSKLASQRSHFRNLLASRDTELKAAVKELKRPCVKDDPAAFQDITSLRKSERELSDKIVGLTSQLESMQKQSALDLETIQELQSRIQQQAALIDSLQAENKALENALADGPTTDEDVCPYDLNGQCLLYVGGRQQTVHRLRDLVAERNGTLVHHDGGLERSMDELARAVVKADAVIFPTDCVSHSAAGTIKRLCQQKMKPYVPLRTSGVASFIDYLQNASDPAIPH